MNRQLYSIDDYPPPPPIQDRSLVHSYILLKDKGRFLCGQLLELRGGKYHCHLHDYGLKYGALGSIDPRLGDLIASPISATNEEVAPLFEEECIFLDAIPTDDGRYAVYNTPGKLAWGMGLKVGDTVLARLPKNEGIEQQDYSTAVIRWYDVNGRYRPIHQFGLEITDEKYYGRGISDVQSLFRCPPKHGLFSSLDKMESLSFSNRAMETNEPLFSAIQKTEEELIMESKKFLANIEKHLQRSGAVNRFIGHIMFVGLPGSGKSTLIARLLNLEEVEAMLKASGSTGVIDGIITVDVAEDEASMHAANIGENYEWHKVEFGLSCLRQMGVQCFILEHQTPEDHTPVDHSPEDHTPGDHTPEDHTPESHTPEDYSPEDYSEVTPGQKNKVSKKRRFRFSFKLHRKISLRRRRGKSPHQPMKADTGKIEEAATGEDQVATREERATGETATGELEADTGVLEAAGGDIQAAKTKEQHQPEDVMATVQRLLNVEGYSAVHPYLEKKISLYLSDTGGQIEFQELLPLLIAGLAIFVFLFPLNVDLDERVTVSYRKKMKDQVEHSNVYKSSLTIRESFLQTLASIDSMEGSSDPSAAKHNPYVFVVGTHKDCLVKKYGEGGAERKIADINFRMKGLITEHGYEKLVIPANKEWGQVLFAVDNTCHNATFGKIRSSIMGLIRSREEFRIQFPLSYLLASLHLQDSSKPFIKRSDFARDVLQYGIDEEDIDHLLQFLNTRIGQIRYFPLKEIREVIVKEPQALYNLVTFLITKSFISHGVTMEEYSEVQRGIYSLESFHVDEFLSQSEFLTPKQVIHLLKELRIVAPFYDRAAGIEKYFIPFVLNHLPEAPVNDLSKTSIVQPLAIMFDSGHCPKGMYGVLLHYILTCEMRLEWYLDINKISRNQVSFNVGPYEEEVSIRVHSSHLEVRYFPIDVSQRHQAFTMKKICNAIRSIFKSGIQQATKSLHYSEPKTKHYFGLVCNDCCNRHRVYSKHVCSKRVMKCPKLGKGLSFLPECGLLWFPELPPCITFPDLVNYVSLKELDDHSMDFNVTSDPSLGTLINYCLSKEEGSCSKDRVFIRDTTVHFKRVRRSDAGTYTVSTFNAVGKGCASFQLRIKSPPVYSLETDYLEAEAGSSPTLTFTVTSDHPLPEGTEYALTKKGVEGSVTKRFKVESGCITFRNIRVEDSGTYTISCCNDEGEVGQATLELEVTPPQPPTPHQPGHQGTTLTGLTIVRSADIAFLASHLCQTVSHKWQEVGLALGFLDGELKGIIVSYPRATAQQLLTELLAQWSQWPTVAHPDPPTLERLRDALRSDLVELGAVASDLYDLRHALPSAQH